MFSGFVPRAPQPLTWAVAPIAQRSAGEAGFPKLATHFKVESVRSYRVSSPQGTELVAVQATFRDRSQAARTAILSMAPQATFQSNTSDLGFEADPRYEIWRDAAAEMKKRVESRALVVSWWDNAQRIHLLTGLDTWVTSPARKGFPNRDEERVWSTLGGTFSENEARLETLAKSLTQDAASAVRTLKATLPPSTPIYFVVTTDDLARLNEMHSLGGAALTLESRIFPVASDVHGAIRGVKQWIDELGGGGYMLQPTNEVAIRAWSARESRSSEALLIRLLPFSDSIARPLPEFRMVYQSGWAGYLTVYQWHPN